MTAKFDIQPALTALHQMNLSDKLNDKLLAILEEASSSGSMEAMARLLGETQNLARQLAESGAKYFVVKPFEDSRLIAALNKAIA